MSATCQASTLKVYLAAIRALHIMHGFQDPLINRTRIPLVIRGLRRKKSIVQRPQKRPITALILHTLKLQLDLSKFDDIMLWAAFCTAFFGFLRAAEFTCQHNTFSPQDNLSVSSVSLDKHPVPDTVFIRISKSKTDQCFKGCSIVLARSDCAICPVAALMSYLRKRGGDSGPLFRFADKSPLTRDKLNSRLQRLITAAGWQGRYTLHSFRIGAATTAASLGFPDYLIKALGRWSSEAYQVYIRLPQQRLHLASRCLATANSFGTSTAP